MANRTKYPWGEWMKTKLKVLRRQEHFKCEPNTLRMYFRKRAADQGIDFSLSIMGDYLVVERRTTKNEKDLPRTRIEIARQIKKAYPKAKV